MTNDRASSHISSGDRELEGRKRNHNCACGEVDTSRMMADTGSEEVAVIGNTDLTPGEIENNIKNTVNSADVSHMNAVAFKPLTPVLMFIAVFFSSHHWQAVYVPGVA